MRSLGRVLCGGWWLALMLSAPACHRAVSQAVTADPAAAPQAVTTSPVNEKARMQAEEWARATRGLDFEVKDGLVGVTRILAGDPFAAKEALGRGDALLGENRIMEALEQYGLAVRHDPELAAGYVGMGVVLERKGKLAYAVRCFRSALEHEPTGVDARYRLAVALWAANDQEQAIAELETLLERNEADARAHERLAVWSYYRDDYSAAWHHLHRAEELGGSVPAQLPGLLAARMADPAPPPGN